MSAIRLGVTATREKLSPEVFTDEMSVQIFWERGRAHWEA